MGNGWNYQSIKEEQGCGNDEKRFFHGCFLLVLEKRTVILSWRSHARKDHIRPLACSEFVTRIPEK